MKNAQSFIQNHLDGFLSSLELNLGCGNYATHKTEEPRVARRDTRGSISISQVK